MIGFLRGISGTHPFVSHEERAMRCETVQDNLIAFARGDSPPDERSAMEAHLRGCPTCRLALGEVDPIAATLVRGQTPPVPGGFAARVMAAARRGQATEAFVGWNPLRWWRLTSTPLRAAAAAVLVVGLTVGLVMGWTSMPSPAQAPVAAQADPLEVYHLDYLGDAPAESLTDSYLALVSGHNGEGR